MYNNVDGCEHVRRIHDTLPETSLFVYKYSTDNLLGLVQEDLLVADIKRILRDTLRGLEGLHESDIVHTGR